MYAVRRPAPSRYNHAKAILRSSMMQITQDIAPGKVKGGTYALLLGSGLVWYSQTISFNGMLRQLRGKKNGPECIQQAWDRGERVEVFLLTKPELFCAEEIREKLEAADVMAARKERDLTGPGKLYAIRHHTTHDYFIIEDRTSSVGSTLLSNFLGRLKAMSGRSRNKLLNNFINGQAADILSARNFSIMEIDQFSNPEDAWLKRQVYIDDCKFGTNLNWNLVD